MSSSDSDSPHQLQLPPVQIDDSLTQINLNALMMRSTPPHSRPEPHSTLGDSTYDMLDLDTCETDDDGQTASIASTEEHTPDNASQSSDDDDEDFDRGSVGEEHEFPEQHYPADIEPGEESFAPSSGHDSVMTEIMDQPRQFTVTMDEDISEGADMVSGSFVVKSFHEGSHTLPGALSRYASSQVRVVVRAPLALDYLPAPQSYRILYIGRLEHYQESMLTSTIGEALQSASTSTQSPVFGGNETKKPLMHTYRCTEVQCAVDQHGQPLSVSVELEDRSKLTFGPRADFPDTRPDLVVFCHSVTDESTPEMQVHLSAKTVFRRLHIPCLNLTHYLHYGSGRPAHDRRSLEVCIEGRDDKDSKYEHKEAINIDYYHLSILDPLQLNRHLAFLKQSVAPRGPSLWSRITLPWTKTGQGMLSMRSMLMTMLMVLMALCSSVLVSSVIQNLAGAGDLAQPAVGSSMSPTISPVASSGSPHIPSLSTDLSEIPKRDLTLFDDLWAIPRKVVGTSTSFDIKSTGDYQFVVFPSKSGNSHSKPQLQIAVSHDAQHVPARLNRTINGDYIVDLESKYSVRTFHVDIATLSKPIWTQSFEITLGHNLTAVDRMLDQAKAHFPMLSSLPEVSEIRSKAAEHIESSKKMVQDVKSLDKLAIAQLSADAWAGLRSITAPARTSDTVIKARLMSLRARCKFDLALGLSSKTDSDQWSWACAKVLGEDME